MAITVENDRWMGALRTQIGDRSLRDLVLPGTHNSATFSIPDPYPHVKKKLAQCQELKIREQLQLGIRFLDIRLKYRETLDNFWAYHGEADTDTTLGQIMGDVKSFFAEPEHDQELLVLRVSHLELGNVKEREERLLYLLTYSDDGKVDPRFAPRPTPRSVESATSLTPNQLLDDGKQIVVIFDNQDPKDDCGYENRFPVWCNDNDSDSNRVLTMDQVFKNTEDINCLEDELAKYQNEQKDQPSLFVLQAVLTPNKLCDSVRELSSNNNKNLLEWISTKATKSRLNIIFMNFVGEEFSRWSGKDLVDIVIEINRQKAGLSSM